MPRIDLQTVFFLSMPKEEDRSRARFCCALEGVIRERELICFRVVLESVSYQFGVLNNKPKAMESEEICLHQMVIEY